MNGDISQVLGEGKSLIVKAALEAWMVHKSAIENLMSSWGRIMDHVGVLQEALEAQKVKLESREAELEKKEKDTAERLQQLKDAAYAAIEAERAKLQKEKDELGPKNVGNHPHPESINTELAHPPNAEVSVYKSDHHPAFVEVPTPEKAFGDASEYPPHPDEKDRQQRDAFQKDSDDGSSEKPPAPTLPQAEIDELRPQLETFFVSVDGNGLREFLSSLRKTDKFNFASSELHVYLDKCLDPMKLVLDALKTSPLLKQKNNPVAGRMSREAVMFDRRACVALLEGLLAFMDSKGGGSQAPPFLSKLSASMQADAKEVADAFLEMETRDGGAGSNSHAFLLSIAAFGIADQYDLDKVVSIVQSVSRRKDFALLCRKIPCLESKIPDLVERMAQDGLPMAALRLAQEYAMMEKLNPVRLLKDYLIDARVAAKEMLHSKIHPSTAQHNAEAKELSALRTVLKCIREFKLEEVFPPSSVEKQIDTIEQVKAGRKRKDFDGRAEQQPWRGFEGDLYGPPGPERDVRGGWRQELGMHPYLEGGGHYLPPPHGGLPGRPSPPPYYVATASSPYPPPQSIHPYDPFLPSSPVRGGGGGGGSMYPSHTRAMAGPPPAPPSMLYSPSTGIQMHTVESLEGRHYGPPAPGGYYILK